MSVSIPEVIADLKLAVDDEVDSEYFDSGTIKRAVNYGTREVFKRIINLTYDSFLELDTSITLVPGTLTYNLPARTALVSNYLDRYGDTQISNANLNTSGVPIRDYRPKMPSSNDNVSRLNLGVHYRVDILNNKFVFFNDPNIAGTLEIYVKKYPANITDLTGTINLPELTKDNIVDFATMKLLQKDEQSFQFQNAVASMRSTIDTLINFQGNKHIMGTRLEYYDSGDR